MPRRDAVPSHASRPPPLSCQHPAAPFSFAVCRLDVEFVGAERALRDSPAPQQPTRHELTLPHTYQGAAEPLQHAARFPRRSDQHRRKKPLRSLPAFERVSEQLPDARQSAAQPGRDPSVHTELLPCRDIGSFSSQGKGLASQLGVASDSLTR